VLTSKTGAQFLVAAAMAGFEAGTEEAVILFFLDGCHLLF
jgi:hypothetical protein